MIPNLQQICKCTSTYIVFCIVLTLVVGGHRTFLVACNDVLELDQCCPFACTTMIFMWETVPEVEILDINFLSIHIDIYI